MAAEAPGNYSPLPTGDDDDGVGGQQGHIQENAHDDVDHDVESHSPHDSETTNVPIIEISPTPSPPSPLSPPTRLNTGNSDTISLSQTLPQPGARPAVQSLDKRRSSSLSGWKERIYSSITPSLHEVLELKCSDHNTSREYRHHKQRNRLLRLTIGEWFNSLVLCVVYFGILYSYSKKQTISVPQRRMFNALTTGVSLLLGVNLAASLRSYAKLLRWRMLAACYRPLETFDLVMGCDSLLNVMRLLWKARNQRRRYLPSRTQVLCILWLLVHLAVTILVGIIGLNYNLDTSNDFVLLRKGNISIVDLNALSTGDYPADLAAVQEWGVRGETTNPLDYESGVVEQYQSYFSSWDGFTFYYFQDQNPDDPNSVGVSSRYIESQAYCQDFTVTEGLYGNLSYIIYHDGEKDVNRSLPASPGPGGLLTISKLNSTCGDGCVEIHTFQAAAYPDDNGGVGDDDENAVGTYFICNNTVPQVGDDYSEVTIDYEIYSIVGRMLAGAIGWSDNPPTADGKEEYAVYTNTSQLSFSGTLGPLDMANVISSFTMGAISFMDNSPAMYRKNIAGRDQPFAAQVLKVTWRYAGTILAVIPFIHFCTLVAVILWANKAIIKDDSHLAIAKVYHTLLRELGDRGCLLRGDEIVAVMGNPQVAYGWQASNEYDGAMHVDVFQGLMRVEKVFAEGMYDGSSKVHRSTANTERTGSARKRYRDVDAADYF
ncbi:uncharacterized protein PV07_03219 [Cladophialophora immunda]|uniref:Uncharacterized protein n=1 Tax=Cladophialophora immunda TaxID=569365 RepID=A0A0D2D7A0_9EURO|nr:uncharacterized protein PV07_03219 [Cladophialophora immunda]KIW31589.1 hypothetical protein PV07_03219 [Cladophialophora immunda]OQV04327.1 hypothetical protein CLAIMM_09227 [Cladophialophora immunda]